MRNKVLKMLIDKLITMQPNPMSFRKQCGDSSELWTCSTSRVTRRFFCHWAFLIAVSVHFLIQLHTLTTQLNFYWSKAIMVFNDGLSAAALVCASSATLLAALAFKDSILKKIGVRAQEVEAKGPKRWLHVGTVSKLLIYPIKGCAGVHVKQAKVTQLGLKDGEFLRDRVFMIVDEDGTYQVQMKHPRLALITVSAAGDDGKITLKGPEMEPLTFNGPKNGYKGPEKLCRIFQERGLKAIDCGEEAAEWIQKYMQLQGMRLVYHHLSESQRNISGLQTQFSTVTKSDLAVFQNYTSYLLIGEESIEELNKHLETKVTYRNFRPSILVSNTPEPFSEIRWGVVRIGKVVQLKASKPCERCKIVTVDPDTGAHDKDGEPLKTLTKLQMDFGDEQAEKVMKNRGIMGLQMGLLSTPSEEEDATIRIGDPVYVALF